MEYKKESPDGFRFDFHGMNTVAPADTLLALKKTPYAQNIRRYLRDRIAGRATQPPVPAIALPASVHSLRRMNDSSAKVPAQGFALISGAADKVYAGNAQVASGLSGNRLSIIPFRPNASPQPWAYVADSSLTANLSTGGFAAAGMLKVRSDGLVYKTGIAEPQQQPIVSAVNAITNGNVSVPSTTQPWSVAGGQNTGYPFTATGGTAPVVIPCTPGSTIVLTGTGTIVTSFASGVTPDTLPPSNGQAANYPGGQGNIRGSFCATLMGAFTDAGGNVVTPTTGTGPVTVGAGPTTFLVPVGAVQLQLGIDDVAYASGSGSFNVSYTLTKQAVSSKVSLLGNVTAYYWGDSPTSGAVATYIWNNPSDPTATANPRSISTAAGSTTNNSLMFDVQTPGNQSTPMQWATLDQNGTTTANLPVFAAPITGSPSGNFANWNMCVAGTLYIPTATTFTFTIKSKDNVMWGIGGGATWPGKGTIQGALGQSVTVVNKASLLPSPAISGSGTATSASVAVTFPAAGSYSIELDYDFWYHPGHMLQVTVGQPDGSTVIVPLTQLVLKNTQYRYRYRSTTTGAKSNPSPSSPQNGNPVQTSTVTPTASTDPQVDVIDYFRMDSGLNNFTYVGTGPNSATGFVDTVLDSSISANELLEYDLFEPFPSIDLPHKGVVNAVGATVTWASGDQFNPRWLGGSLIKIGGVEYALYNRPSSATQLTVADVANGTNLAYEIAAGTLAQQPTASTWGPTAQGGFMFGTDPNNPGDIVWTNGNDPDSSADTNRYQLTSPSEPMMNGCITNGISVAFSTERSWLFYPTFTSAAATVTGTQGSPFNPVLSSMKRGLYIRSCLAVAGGGLIFFRAKDGICVSEEGGAEQSITDDDIYNLFQHESSVIPAPVTVAGFTVYPPDDSQPEAQALSCANGYLYYDYKDVGGTPRTLVFDIQAKGWVVDAYQFQATVHALEEGKVNETLTGCSDGSIRPLQLGAPETQTAVLLTAAVNGGEARANKTFGDIFMKASVAASASVSVTPYSGRFTNALPASTLAGTGASQKYVLDFSGGEQQVDDIELALTWPVGFGTIVEMWQPNWTDLPDTIQNRTTDWTDCGTPGAKFIQGMLLEANSFNAAKSFRIQRSDDLAYFTPDQVPVTFNGQSIVALTFTPPFIAHSIRLVATDAIPWQQFSMKPVFVPYPELVGQFQTEFTSHGSMGWNTIGEITLSHLSTSDLTLTLNFDQWPTITLTIPNSGGVQTKGPKMPVPANKWKLVSYRVSSAAPFRLFQAQCEVRVGQWGRQDAYRLLNPFGGPSAEEAVV